MEKLSNTQIFTLRRMLNGTRYLASGDGRRGDECRVDRAYSCERPVNAPSIPVLLRLGYVEFVYNVTNDPKLNYRVRLTDKGKEAAEKMQIEGGE
ncbi:Uncharacterised protein [Yersinia frederiksenii]|uniref:hypothetical protein n=1 Tax=Yersinia frederiksenii TaxID=29484 RepID=UPI0005DDBA80|nr:hypothetical protein [Yersinia frederiksenii]CND07634.1 Uncharacterised protein [Yersinia frederiksenii]